MHPLTAAILGIVEGLTEFLPISSTGHLMIASALLRLETTEFVKSFAIAIQLGAILAVVMLYARTLFLHTAVTTRVLAAFLPTGIIGFLLHPIVKVLFLESLPLVLWALFLGGIALIVFDYFHDEKSAASTQKDTVMHADVRDLSSISFRQALAIGCCQALAIIPGVSRAAATIVGGQLLGIRRTTIVEFSFLLAVPTMAAATGYDLLQSASVFSSADFTALAIGFVVSFVTAIIAIRWLLRFIKHHSFAAFGIYRILLAGAVGGWLLL